MADASAVLQSWIAKMRAIGRNGLERTAAEAAPLIEAELKTSAAAGVDPYGEKWPDRKSGGQPMVNAADHIKATAQGAKVTVTLEGPDKWHQYGSRGEPRRAVIPDTRKVPVRLVPAIEEASRRAFAALVGGR